jgi:hypothetical protein
MSARQIFHACIIALSCVLADISMATADEQEPEAKSHPLRGFHTINVSISGIKDKEFARTLKTKAELLLRKTGIEISEDEQKPMLYLELYVRSIENRSQNGGLRGYCYTQAINVYTITRIVWTDTFVLSRIWTTRSYIGTTPSGELYSTLIDNTEQLSEEFLNEYLKANPLH